MRALISCGMFLAFQVLLLSCSDAAERNETLDRPEEVTRSTPLLVGVGIHFGIGGEYNYVADKTIRAMNELGVDSYRDDLAWSLFDPDGDGRGNGQPAKLFDLMRKAPQRPLLVLGHPNPAIKGGQPPITDEGRAKFSGFVAEAVRTTAEFKPIYEIWNEWNMNAQQATSWLSGAGTPDDPRAAVYYTALARAAVPAVRQAVSDATVLVGAVGADNGWPWAKAIIDGGAADDATALSVHLYNHCEVSDQKRTATEFVDRLGRLQDILGKGAAPIPIYVTEFGWPTATAQCVIDRQIAADNVAQFLFWSAATPWIKGVWIYQLKDQGKNPAEFEDNFGLYDYDYKPKPAACAAREAIRLIKASTGLRLQRPFPDMFLLRARTKDGARLIAWTTPTAAKATLTFMGAEVSAVRGLCSGNRTPESGGSYTIGTEPVIFDIKDVQSLTVHVSQN